MRKIILLIAFLLVANLGFAGPYITPYNGAGCYDPLFGNVYQTRVSGSGIPANTFDYDVNYSGQYTDLSCSVKSSLGAAGSCVLRSYGVNYSGRGRLFTITNYIPCPVDTYIPALLGFIGVFGFFYLKKGFQLKSTF